jgi:hypothetical protein
MSFGLAPHGGIYMQFERGKPPETPNAPFRAARIKDERWRCPHSHIYGAIEVQTLFVREQHLRKMGNFWTEPR